MIAVSDMLTSFPNFLQDRCFSNHAAAGGHSSFCGFMFDR